jgi:hypothetical protein
MTRVVTRARMARGLVTELQKPDSPPSTASTATAASGMSTSALR